jgi:hypothetical protein
MSVPASMKKGIASRMKLLTPYWSAEGMATAGAAPLIKKKKQTCERKNPCDRHAREKGKQERRQYGDERIDLETAFSIGPAKPECRDADHHRDSDTRCGRAQAHCREFLHDEHRHEHQPDAKPNRDEA